MVSLTITRYPWYFAFFGMLSMAIFRLSLGKNRNLSFYKLLGSAKDNTFEKVDLCRWMILAVHRNEITGEAIYGNFIESWWKLFRCSTQTYILQPIEGHGQWDGKQPFNFINETEINDKIAVITRATIRIGAVKEFWSNIASVAKSMKSLEGLIFTAGMGEIPVLRQATFSVWENMDSMKAFAYRQKDHTDVIRQTRARNWYKEEMFVRFKVIKTLDVFNKN